MEKRKAYLFQLFSLIILALCFLGTVNYVRVKIYDTLNADEASPMVLGEMLAAENSLVSKNWHYSTELEVINTNLFYSFFFHFSNNWHHVRIFALISMYLVLLLSYYFMSRTFSFRKYFALTAALFFIPFSGVYYGYILKSPFYLPVLVISILTLAASELQRKISGWKFYVLMTVFFLFSVGVGMGGLRSMFFTYIPLLASALINYFLQKEAEQKRMTFSVISFIGSVIGYIINIKLLSKIYTYDSWGLISFTDLNFPKLGQIVNGFFTSFGYVNGFLFSNRMLNNLVSLLWVMATAIAIGYAFKNHRNVSAAYLRLAIFVFCSYVFFAGLYAFTDMLYMICYNLSIIGLSFPLIAMFPDQVKWKKEVSSAALAVLVLLTMGSGALYYASHRNQNPNNEIRRIVRTLVSEGYLNGYSTFWRANQMTELSNGQIEVWNWCDNGGDKAKNLPVYDIDQTQKWLQKVSHNTTHPSGKIFMFLTKGEYKNNYWGDKLRNGDVIYQSDKYTVLGFDSYDALTAILYPDYEFVFGDNQWLDNGNDINGHRELYHNGVSYGPHQTFWPGTYEIEIHGDNLLQTETKFTDEEGAKVFDLLPVENSDETLRYELELPEKCFNAEVVISSSSDDPETVVRINSLSIKRTKTPD